MIEELTIKAVKEGRTLIIRVKGRINTNTAPKFEEAAKVNLEGTGKVILDFTELEYMSSAGIRVVLMIFKETGRDRKRLIVRNPNADITDVLTITGFAERVTIERKAAKPATKKPAFKPAAKKTEKLAETENEEEEKGCDEKNDRTESNEDENADVE